MAGKARSHTRGTQGPGPAPTPSLRARWRSRPFRARGSVSVKPEPPAGPSAPSELQQPCARQLRGAWRSTRGPRSQIQGSHQPDNGGLSGGGEGPSAP